MRDLRYKALVFLIALALFLAGVGAIGLYETDGARYPEVAREMIETGDYITPKIDYIKFFDKPIMHYWLVVSAIKVFGPNELGALFWTALLAALGALLIYDLGRLLVDRRTGLLAGLCLATTFAYYGVAHISSMDMTLTFFCTLFLYGFIRGYLADKDGNKAGWYYLAYAAMAGALLTKGLIGLLIPAMVLGAWLVTTRQLALLKEIRLPQGLLILVLIAAPWFVAISLKHPDFPRYFFVQEHFLRYTTSMHRRSQPFFFYIVFMLIGGYPWLGFFFKDLGQCWLGRKRDASPEQKTFYLLFLWVLLIIAFFSISNSKLVTYITPVFPAMSLLAGQSLAAYAGGKRREDFRLGWGYMLAMTLVFALGTLLYAIWIKAVPAYITWPLAALFVFLVGLGYARWRHGRREHEKAATSLVLAAVALFFILKGLLVAVTPLFSAKHLAAEIAQAAPAEYRMIQYRGFYYGLAFYLKKRIVMVDHNDNMAYGLTDRDKGVWFLTTEQLLAQWSEETTILMVVGRKDYRELQEKGLRAQVLAETPRGDLLVSNKSREELARLTRAAQSPPR